MPTNTTTNTPTWTIRHRCRGSRNGRSRLVAEDVADIKTASNVTQRALAEHFGVSPSLISGIRRGTRWAWLHVGTPAATPTATSRP